MKKWLLVLIPAALVAPFLMSVSTALCACTSPVDDMLVYAGVNPMKASPEEARSAFLKKMPVGTPESRIQELWPFSSSHCRPAKTYTGQECRFEQRDVESIFGNYREGFQIDLHLDSQGVLRDVRFTNFRNDR
jgi:hypothetical protein